MRYLSSSLRLCSKSKDGKRIMELRSSDSFTLLRFQYQRISINHLIYSYIYFFGLDFAYVLNLNIVK